MYSRNLFQFKYGQENQKEKTGRGFTSFANNASGVFFKKYDERSIKHFTETSDLDWLNVCIYHEIRIHK